MVGEKRKYNEKEKLKAKIYYQKNKEEIKRKNKEYYERTKKDKKISFDSTGNKIKMPKIRVYAFNPNSKKNLKLLDKIDKLNEEIERLKNDK